MSNMLDEMTRLNEARTPGDWEACGGSVGTGETNGDEMSWVANGTHIYDGGPRINQREDADAEFIAASASNMTELIRLARIGFAVEHRPKQEIAE